MSISELGSSSTTAGTAAHRRHGDANDFSRFRVGQQLNLYIREQLAADRYVVEFAGTQHIVEAAMSMTAGATLAATVVTIGDKLELKLTPSSNGNAGSSAAMRAERQHEDAASELLEEITDQFAIVLNDADQTTLVNAMRDASQPAEMAQAGLFLSKLQHPVETSALQALYAAFLWAPKPTSLSAGQDRNSDLQPGRVDSLATELERQFAARLEGATVEAATDGQVLAGKSADRGDEDRRARELLNSQDEGSVAYAYGSLPILIADQLVELDVVLFRDRQSANPSNARRRLVMTLQTEHLGRVEIMAQALGSRLTIAIKTDTAGASSALAAHADEAKELVSQLGWNVESIDYDVDPLRTRAAREIVDHVLKSGSVDRLV